MNECPYCKGTGIWKSSHELWKYEDFRRMLSDRRQMTLDCMARKYGVSYQRLQQLLKKARKVCGEMET